MPASMPAVPVQWSGSTSPSGIRHAAPQHGDDVEQDVVQVRVEVAEHRPLHRVEHGGVDVRGSGAAEQPLRRVEHGQVRFMSYRVTDVDLDINLRVSRES